MKVLAWIGLAEASSAVDCFIAQECDDVGIILVLSLEWSCKSVPGNNQQL